MLITVISSQHTIINDNYKMTNMGKKKKKKNTTMLMQYKQLFSTTIVFSCLVWVWICCSVIVHFLGLPLCYSLWQHKVYSQIVLCLFKCSLSKLNLKFNHSRVHWREFEQVKNV